MGGSYRIADRGTTTGRREPARLLAKAGQLPPPMIDQILADDEDAPRKQWRTAAQILRRLRDEEGCPGGDDQVRRYVGRRRRTGRGTFILPAHDPGPRPCLRPSQPNGD